MARFNFSGHDTFHCRPLWLKKGYDFSNKNLSFSSDDSVLELGVGKNMVNAIRHWMRSFDLLNDEDQLTDFAHLIFNNDGLDPYLEDRGTLWLLHYLITKKGKASIYKLIFSDLREKRPEFSQDDFVNYVVNDLQENQSLKTLMTDYQVFNRTYVNKKDNSDLEESYTGLLTDLELVSKIEKEEIFFSSDQKKSKKISRDSIQAKPRPSLPAEILLYLILLEYPESQSISYKNLIESTDSIGKLFALDSEGMIDKLEEIAELPYKIVFSNNAGVRELQLKEKKLKPEDVLNNYYKN